MRLATRPLASLALALAALSPAGCAEDFPPASVIEDQRILALLAEPPELDGRDLAVTTRVSAVEAAPPGFTSGAGLARAWSFCPFTLGASTAYRCALPQCETPLLPDAGGAVTVAPVQLALQCLADFGGALPPDVLGGGTLPDQVEVVVRYRLLRPAAGGAAPEALREAVQRIPVWTVAPTRTLNTAPAFDAVPLVIGENPAPVPCDLSAPLGSAACPPAATLPEGGRLAVRAQVTPASFEDYPAGERTTTEALAVSFFTSAGRFTDERGALPHHRAEGREAGGPGGPGLPLGGAARPARGPGGGRPLPGRRARARAGALSRRHQPHCRPAFCRSSQARSGAKYSRSAETSARVFPVTAA